MRVYMRACGAQVMALFRFLQGKDVFEAFYKTSLSKRLLLGETRATVAVLYFWHSHIFIPAKTLDIKCLDPIYDGTFFQESRQVTILKKR